METTPTLRPACRADWAPAGPARPAWGVCGLWGLPGLRLHRLCLREWTLPDLRIAVVADPHVNLPWMTPARMRAIVAQVNALGADIVLVAGDLLPDRYMPCRHLRAREIVPLLAPLRAPLGVFCVMGNHDWKDCARSRRTGGRENSVVDAFRETAMPLVRNGAVHIAHGTDGFWLVMFDSQTRMAAKAAGRHDPGAAFAGVPDGAPAILLAHEPDYFAKGDRRALLQVSGHTHGGQFVLFGRRPMTPSVYGDRYADGHIVEDGRHLIVSAGIGYSGLPFRFGVPPEITLIDLRPE